MSQWENEKQRGPSAAKLMATGSAERGHEGRARARREGRACEVWTVRGESGFALCRQKEEEEKDESNIGYGKCEEEMKVGYGEFQEEVGG